MRRTDPELDLLLARPPRALDDLSVERRRALVETAFRHGALQAVADRLIPGDALVRARFGRLAALVRVRDAALRATLEVALAALDASAVQVCALKGPVLADRIYPDPTLRGAGDLDLLVREDQLEVAVVALEREGWRRARGFRARYERRHTHHVTLVHRERAPIELHFRPQSAFGARLRSEDLLSRARPHATGRGASVGVLAPEDELLFLALHAAHHLVERRGWVLDLLLLLDAHPDLDWSAVAERARTSGCRRAVGLVLLHLHALGASVPESLRKGLGRWRRGIAERLRRAALARRKGDRLGHALRVAFEAVLCDGPLLAARRVALEGRLFVRRRVHRAVHRLRSAE